MKFTALVSLSLAAMAAAASLNDVPSCARQCLQDAVSQTTSCSDTDINCVCGSFDKVQGAATGCIISKCGTDAALSKLQEPMISCWKRRATDPSFHPQTKSFLPVRNSAPAQAAAAAAAARVLHSSRPARPQLCLSRLCRLPPARTPALRLRIPLVLLPLRPWADWQCWRWECWLCRMCSAATQDGAAP